MKKAIIYYKSKTGTTKAYAEAIGNYLQSKKMHAEWHDISEKQPQPDSDTDLILAGCWTKGLMVVMQHPDSEWNRFARNLAVPENARVALFTTYKLRTGSMFRKMAKQLDHKEVPVASGLKSKDGGISDHDRMILDDLIHSRENAVL